MHDDSHDCTFTIRPITLTHAPSSDHLITRTMLSLRRTTLAFIAQRTHQDVRHISRSVTYHCTTVAYWRLRTCVLSYEHLFHANIHTTDCEVLHAHDILVASDRAPVVKGRLRNFTASCWSQTKGSRLPWFGFRVPSNANPVVVLIGFPAIP